MVVEYDRTAIHTFIHTIIPTIKMPAWPYQKAAYAQWTLSLMERLRTWNSFHGALESWERYASSFLATPPLLHGDTFDARYERLRAVSVCSDLRYFGPLDRARDLAKAREALSGWDATHAGVCGGVALYYAGVAYDQFAHNRPTHEVVLSVLQSMGHALASTGASYDEICTQLRAEAAYQHSSLENTLNTMRPVYRMFNQDDAACIYEQVRARCQPRVPYTAPIEAIDSSDRVLKDVVSELGVKPYRTKEEIESVDRGLSRLQGNVDTIANTLRKFDAEVKNISPGLGTFIKVCDQVLQQGEVMALSPDEQGLVFHVGPDTGAQLESCLVECESELEARGIMAYLKIKKPKTLSEAEELAQQWLAWFRAK